MPLGWIDFSKNDRNIAFSVLKLLEEPGAVDEMGIGIFRDAFADILFTGTSTIQTRAKYFIYRAVYLYGTETPATIISTRFY